MPTPESEGERGTPEPTNEGYGFAKLMGEKLAHYYTREEGMEVVIARRESHVKIVIDGID